VPDELSDDSEGKAHEREDGSSDSFWNSETSDADDSVSERGQPYHRSVPVGHSRSSSEALTRDQSPMQDEEHWTTSPSLQLHRTEEKIDKVLEILAVMILKQDAFETKVHKVLKDMEEVRSALSKAHNTPLQASKDRRRQRTSESLQMQSPPLSPSNELEPDICTQKYIFICTELLERNSKTRVSYYITFMD
jgi:hypothetical protein